MITGPFSFWTRIKYLEFNSRKVRLYLTNQRAQISLRASSPGCSGGGAGKGRELATTSVEFQFHLQFPCGSSSTELSDFRQSAWNGNERECKQTLKTRAKGNDVITIVISANQHFASIFPMQIFKFQRRSCKLSFLFPPRRQSALESLLAG